MTGQFADEHAEHAVLEPSEVMPPAFWAFHELYHRAYVEYARIQLGDPEAANDLVDAAFVLLAVLWPHLTAQENLGASAWALLKEQVAAALAAQGREPAAPQTMAFERAIHAACGPLLDNFRQEFHAQVAELEEGIGLYAALGRLPERQFDVMVLRFALHFTTRRTALVMGIREATVRSTCRTAKRRLAAELGLALGEEVDSEE